MKLNGWTRLAFVPALVVAAAALIGAGSAAAATYPAGGSSFTGSAEGWHVVGEPTCNVNLLGILGACKGNGGYDGSAGHPAGSLKAETEILVDLAGLFSAKVAFESPTFKAVEGGGATLRLEREVASASAVNLNPEASYAVRLLDRSAGTSAQVMSGTVTSAEAGFGGQSGSATLVGGHSYALAIETETKSSLASIGPLGSSVLRFDNVDLTGPGSNEGGGNGGNGGDGANGHRGANGKNGQNGIGDARLSRLARASVVGPVVVKGRRVFVKARCPSSVGRACRVSLRGLLRRGRAATAVRTAKLPSGKARRLVLSVKPKARAAVSKRRKLLFETRIEAGGAKATLFDRLKLIRR